MQVYLGKEPATITCRMLQLGDPYLAHEPLIVFYVNPFDVVIKKASRNQAGPERVALDTFVPRGAPD